MPDRFKQGICLLLCLCVAAQTSCPGNAQSDRGHCRFQYSGVCCWGTDTRGELGVGYRAPDVMRRLKPNQLVIADMFDRFFITDTGDLYSITTGRLIRIQTDVKFKYMIPLESRYGMYAVSVDGLVYQLLPDVVVAQIPLINTAAHSESARIAYVSNGLFISTTQQISTIPQYNETHLFYRLQVGPGYFGKIIKAAGGASHIAVITADNKILSVGSNDAYQLGNIQTSFGPTAPRLQEKLEFVDIKAGRYFTVAITKEGHVYFWGTLMVNLLTQFPVRLGLPHVTEFSQINAGDEYLVLVSKNGIVYAMGSNDNGQLLDHTMTNRVIPVECITLNSEPITNTFIRGLQATYISSDSVIEYNGNDGLVLHNIWNKIESKLLKDEVIVKVQGQSKVSMLVTQSGRLLVSGANDGFLGDGSLEDARLPVYLTVPGNVSIAYASPYDTYTAVVTNTNDLYVWGSFYCGNNTMINRIPVLAVPVVNMTITAIYEAMQHESYFATADSLYYCNQNTSFRLVTFPPELGITKLIVTSKLFNAVVVATDNNRIVIVGHNNMIAAFLQYIIQDTYANYNMAVLKPGPFQSKDIALITSSLIGSAISVIVILHDGTSYRSNLGVWTTYIPLDPKLSSDKLLVMPNGTMLLEWQGSNLNRFSKITLNPPKGEEVKKIDGVIKTSYGAVTIMLKCSQYYVGDNCEIPVCGGRNASDPLTCFSRGICVGPDQCQCDDFNTGPLCNRISGLSIALITVASTLLVLQVLLTCLCVCTCGCYFGRKITRKLQSQRDAEIEMESLLRESLINIETLSEQVDRDWVIPLSEIKFTEKLSEGSFGVVFKGRYQNSDVAIKVTKDNAMNMDLFEKEIKILRSLRHPNIVLFMGVAITEESRFIITELMLGKSLDAFIHGGTIKLDSDSLHNRISFEKKVELLNDVVKGMIYLHGLEPTIVHRDLKPSNILLDKNKQSCKVCDFGTATFVSKNNTMTGAVGTILYMAPEIFLNQVTIEHRTKLDVYSFGIIMYEMFFEEVPYSQNFEQYDSIITLGNRIAGGLRPQMPEHLIQNLTGAERRYLGLMERCWSKKPEDRPSFDEIYSEFAKIEQ